MMTIINVLFHQQMATDGRMSSTVFRTNKKIKKRTMNARTQSRDGHESSTKYGSLYGFYLPNKKSFRDTSTRATNSSASQQQLPML